MIRTEDRLLVVEVAVEIFCARIQANAGKHGYSPDMAMCVGEAAALVNSTYLHIAPQDRPAPLRSDRRIHRRGGATLELDYEGG
jgi:hypothetical protein